MPRLKKTQLNPKAGLDARYIRGILADGHFWLFLAPPNVRERPGDDVLRAAWELLRGELLPAHIAKAPATRPWAWWRFDAIEPRRMLHAGRLGPSGPVESFGMPSRFGPAGDANAPGDLPVYESQRDYLTRLSLLTEGE